MKESFASTATHQYAESCVQYDKCTTAIVAAHRKAQENEPSQQREGTGRALQHAKSMHLSP